MNKLAAMLAETMMLNAVLAERLADHGLLGPDTWGIAYRKVSRLAELLDDPEASYPTEFAQQMKLVALSIGEKMDRNRE